MERDRTQLALVESAVSAAVARLQPKLEFWGTGAETPETNWERPGALGEESLEGLLNSINLESFWQKRVGHCRSRVGAPLGRKNARAGPSQKRRTTGKGRYGHASYQNREALAKSNSCRYGYFLSR
ncbi:MAG: hypothetical protein UX88_C0010G0012 [Candidatus Woesebacteria bacterium GW2011_GWC2_47_16]|uniref:Uncharacterized protein n=8 Tax=Candidatus Woeseibacteriota TaxID=1752722 RepID=A0A0G1QUA5_9BACT|nr:MAG: hypothetical protein UX03_C0007G0011 [Candidatus Woesebacteria bacterium GW2011_GWE1_45_18]KKU25043.1 MAG: hypothetical protein UX34_C0004G0009 [Candidatus Woesebacteria bacterium GW2011_GWF1_46_13]KKU48474.1 MAG: hypothetical protein UX67_C0014G0007 [Candidatus Woesebacteria bacterium GW2011_GWF2_46_8]KKU64687.1 MAG: hypothetical protein UX88_C0010G0012 [Candidatus Woesebacteria bacterium GW2011_GWC2_47_16]KKU70929.1 MAG: hypothetical protein UX95_C0009G0004 [Candidatus Woesebacteria b